MSVPRDLAALEADELKDRLPELDRLPFIEQVKSKRLLAQYRNDLAP